MTDNAKIVEVAGLMLKLDQPPVLRTVLDLNKR
jgi:hypothetical protein